MKTDRELLEEQRRRKEWRKDQAAFDAAIAGTSRNDDKGER